MATPSKNGNQVSITCEIWLDQTSGKVHLSSTDSDLPKGLHTTLRGAAEQHARTLLAKYSKPS